MTLRPDLVLVKLPPPQDERKVKLIGMELDAFLAAKGIDEFQRLTKLQYQGHPCGRVVQVGKGTHDVWPGDLVLLAPNAGQEWDVADERGLPWPHLLVSEGDIDAVLESEHA